MPCSHLVGAPFFSESLSERQRIEASSRTVLELIAGLMEASFERLGEGILLGTMPRYLEDFGRRNAEYMAKKYVHCDSSVGAVSALTGLNYISRVTGTPFAMPVARKDQAIKRLQACEFQAAFQGRSDFVRAMVCLLHLSTYRGAINALVEVPESEGYQVDLESRILFGDDHCDFHVRSIPPRPVEGDTECRSKYTPTEAEMAGLSHHFYTAILVSFVDYLLRVLPEEDVRDLVGQCAQGIGTKVARLLNDDQTGPEAATAWLRETLLLGGQVVETTPDATRVMSCPFADAILSTTKRHDPDEATQLRQQSCQLCKGLLQGVASAADPEAVVARDTCLTQGDSECRFRITDHKEGPPTGG